MRLCLVVATTFFGYFEKLATLFLSLGTSWSLHEDFAQLFPKSMDLQTRLCECMILVLKLCPKVVSFMQKNFVVQVLSSMGSSFDDKFGLIRQQVVQRGRLIQLTAQQFAVRSQLEAESKSAERFGILSRLVSKEAQNTRSDVLRYQILQHLSPLQTQHETATTERHLPMDIRVHSLHGMEVRATIFHLVCDGETWKWKNCGYGQPRGQDRNRRAMCIFLLYSQRTRKLESDQRLAESFSLSFDSLGAADKTWHEILEKGDTYLRGLSSLEKTLDFVLQFLPRDRRYIVIIDGLENCFDEELKDIFVGLQRLRK